MNEIECIFCRISSGNIPAEIVYSDDVVIAFPDIHPKKPVHVLIIPRIHVANIAALEEDTVMAGIRKAVQALIGKYELEGKGYKVEINGGGLQDVEHLHVHLTGPYL